MTNLTPAQAELNKLHAIKLEYERKMQQASRKRVRAVQTAKATFTADKNKADAEYATDTGDAQLAMAELNEKLNGIVALDAELDVEVK